jgi:nitrous oxidase accessory protein
MALYCIWGGRTLRITVGIIIIALLLAGSAGAATLTVNASGGADYTRIQDAINASSSRDTIEVQSGTYYENVNVTKRLTLRGTAMPVVDARGSGSAITLSVNGITLDGFTAIGAGDYPEAGIRLNYSSNNTLIDNNASNNDYGMYLSSFSNNNMLSGNNVSSNNADGIYLDSSSYNTLKDNKVSNNFFGIRLYGSSYNTLEGNNANSNNGWGIFIMSSSYNMLSGNMMTENTYNFQVEGYSDLDFDNQIDTNNLVDSKPIYYIKKASNKIYDSSINAGNFYCISCVNVTIMNMDLNKNGVGIYFWNTSHSRIQNINASNNGDGISLYYSSNNTLSGNNVSNNFNGIHLGSSSNNTLSGNTVSSNNVYGIGGIVLWGSGSNTIYNNLFNNTNNFDNFDLTDTNSNIWNITKTSGTNIIGGPYLGGNFWSHPNATGFSQTCPDDNKDGICDSLYALDSNNIDYLPLTVPTAPPTGAPAIISFSPLTSTVMDNVGVIRTFNIITNQAVNVTWQINGTEVFNETSVITSSYTNTSAAQGIWNVTAVVENSNGSAMHKWIWVVTAGPIPPVPEQSTIVLVPAGLLGMLLILRRFGGSELR